MSYTLNLHLGFMPEEITAKLKPNLQKIRNRNWHQQSILIITRDDLEVEARELFEQPIACYPKKLKKAIEAKQHSVTFKDDKNDPETQYEELKKNIEKFLDFEIQTFL